MAVSHLEFLVEDATTEALLNGVLPCICEGKITFQVYSFNGKPDLLRKLSSRLNGYASWLPADYRIVIVLDRDDDDCLHLKATIEEMARRASLRLTTDLSPRDWQVLIRIAIEEIEAWLLGDMDAIRAAYPRIPSSLGKRQKFRDPDNVKGGTWEALEQALQKAGYFSSGLRKIEFARAVAKHMNPISNQSRSFQCLFKALCEVANKGFG